MHSQSLLRLLPFFVTIASAIPVAQDDKLCVEPVIARDVDLLTWSIEKRCFFEKRGVEVASPVEERSPRVTPVPAWKREADCLERDDCIYAKREEDDHPIAAWKREADCIEDADCIYLKREEAIDPIAAWKREAECIEDADCIYAKRDEHVLDPIPAWKRAIELKRTADAHPPEPWKRLAEYIAAIEQRTPQPAAPERAAEPSIEERQAECLNGFSPVECWGKRTAQPAVPDRASEDAVPERASEDAVPERAAEPSIEERCLAYGDVDSDIEGRPSGCWGGK